MLVNNAGAGAIMSLSEATAERIVNIFAVNVVGPSLLVRAALPHLAAAKGAIVNISSTFGHKPGAAHDPVLLPYRRVQAGNNLRQFRPGFRRAPCAWISGSLFRRPGVERALRRIGATSVGLSA
ncbi:SDR family NAD(P)-dependent oxidoreductase [Mesorhizobium sp. ASY16-5R]|uniref:SDR family NAD(P)-dependent oxidoreductase n=1 Tax=Mesorhizobium sp. ASY16-5R TaxID=3445772 RepID=UPI003F9F6A5A